MQVTIARTGEKPQPGTVYFPPEGLHLDLGRDGSFQASDAAPYQGHRPSVNVTFTAVARYYGGDSIAALLTGMGDDGANGLDLIARAGGTTIAQDQATSTVYGMPRAAIERGAAGHVLPLGEIAGNILNFTETART
jgi:two-component system chemotaxis response regulator CheB